MPALEQEPKTIALQEQEGEITEQEEVPDDLSHVTESIRHMQEPELDATDQRLQELTYVHALNTETQERKKRFESTTERFATRIHSYTKGEKRTANDREEVANQVELDALNDATIPNLQNALRHSENGILPLLRQRDKLLEDGANADAKNIQEKITAVAQTTIDRLPDTLKGKQIKAFLEDITAAPPFPEDQKVNDTSKETPPPSLRKEFQEKVILSLRKVDILAANILDNQLHAMERMRTDEERKQALEQLKDTLKGRLDKKIQWEQTEARIDQLGRMLTQEKSLAEKRKTAQTAFAA